MRETLRSFPAPLRRRLSKALLDENMKPADSNELMRLLSEGASANEVSAWLDSKNIEEIPEEAADAVTQQDAGDRDVEVGGAGRDAHPDPVTAADPVGSQRRGEFLGSVEQFVVGFPTSGHGL